MNYNFFVPLFLVVLLNFCSCAFPFLAYFVSVFFVSALPSSSSSAAPATSTGFGSASFLPPASFGSPVHVFLVQFAFLVQLALLVQVALL